MFLQKSHRFAGDCKKPLRTRLGLSDLSPVSELKQHAFEKGITDYRIIKRYTLSLLGITVPHDVFTVSLVARVKVNDRVVNESNYTILEFPYNLELPLDLLIYQSLKVPVDLELCVIGSNGQPEFTGMIAIGTVDNKYTTFMEIPETSLPLYPLSKGKSKYQPSFSFKSRTSYELLPHNDHHVSFPEIPQVRLNYKVNGSVESLSCLSCLLCGIRFSQVYSLLLHLNTSHQSFTFVLTEKSSDQSYSIEMSLNGRTVECTEDVLGKNWKRAADKCIGERSLRVLNSKHNTRKRKLAVKKTVDEDTITRKQKRRTRTSPRNPKKQVKYFHSVCNSTYSPHDPCIDEYDTDTDLDRSWILKLALTVSNYLSALLTWF